MKDIYINPDIVDKDDVDGLKDMIILAYEDAVRKEIWLS